MTATFNVLSLNHDLFINLCDILQKTTKAIGVSKTQTSAEEIESGFNASLAALLEIDLKTKNIEGATSS